MEDIKKELEVLENNEQEINENELESVSGGEDMWDAPAACAGGIGSSNVVGCLTSAYGPKPYDYENHIWKPCSGRS